MEATVSYLLILQKYIKAKNSEIKDYTLRLRNISKDFTINNMKKTWLKGIVKFFSVDFNPIDINDVLDTHRYLMTRKQYKIIFGLHRKMFMGLLINVANASDLAKCMSQSNQECMTQPALINLHPNECNQQFHYDPFVVKLDRCVGSCNTLNDLSKKVCVPNDMITRIKESKTLAKHISCECKWRFDGRKYYSDHWWNNNKCRCECKNRHVCEKDYICNPSTCSREKYLKIFRMYYGWLSDYLWWSYRVIRLGNRF